MEPVTPSQTIGPFFHEGLAWAVTTGDRRGAGESLVVGTLTDARGDGVSDGLLEIWQPGRARAEFQRVATGMDGRFAFSVTHAGDGPAMAHVTLFARGLNGALRTRVYVGASVAQLKTIAEFRHVSEERLATLIASSADPTERTYRWPIRLQGTDETVFFALV
jgi:protocatechuate 3,4-dioxygenase alpha subunit